MLILVIGLQGCKSVDTLKNSSYGSGYYIENTVYSPNGSYIEYPQLYGMDDQDVEYKLNNMIKDFIMKKSGITKEMETFLLPDGIIWTDTLTVNYNYEITLQTSEILSILFRGSSDFQSSPMDHYTNQEAYGLTIDIKTQTELKLADFASLNEELVEKIQDAPAVNSFGENIDEEEKQAMLGINNIDDKKKILEGLKNEYAFYTYCISEKTLIISIPVAHASGDYMLLNICY